MSERGLITIRRAAILLAPALLAASFAAYAAEAPGQGFPLRGSAVVPASASVPAPAPAPAAIPATSNATTVPAAAPAISAAGNFENQPFAFPDGARRHSRPGQTKGDNYSMPSVLPALFYVAVVCGGFIAVLYLVKRYLPGHRQLFSHPAMEVLGRTHLDQRRYVSLLRVGKRILVLGVSPDEISPLSEITDDAEITGIMEVARPKTEMGLTIFQRLFQRQVVEGESAEARAMAAEKARELEERTVSLRKQVDAIRGRDGEPEPRRRLDKVG